MAITQSNSKEWLDKLQSGKISESEKEALRTYIKASYKDEQLNELMQRHWDSMSQMESAEGTDLSLIQTKLLSFIAKDQSRSNRLLTNWKMNLMRIAAVLFIPLLLVSSFLLYTVFQQNQSGSGQVVMQEVIATPGSRVHFTLPDKTEVWLNSGSKLEFPVAIGEQQKRMVKLWGQGYFKVASDKNRPFVVETGELNIQVLGTSFDVSNYANDLQFNATLEEGKIALLTPSGKEIAQLVPGQQASLNKTTHEFSVEKVNTQLITSWKDGQLIFDDTALPEVIKQLERWYNCEIELQEGVSTSDYSFKATIQDETLGEVLKMIELSTPLKAKQINRNVKIWAE